MPKQPITLILVFDPLRTQLTGSAKVVIFTPAMEKKSQDTAESPKIYITKIIGGKVFSSVLKKGGGDEPILKSPGYSLISDGDSLGRVKSRITIECPSCGCSKEKFEETGRFGCTDCYRAFGPFLSGLLRKMHKGLQNIGKIPQKRVSRSLLEDRIQLLNVELEQAVGRENFEEAAKFGMK